MKRFARSSEQVQCSRRNKPGAVINELETESEAVEPAATVTIAEHDRKNRVGNLSLKTTQGPNGFTICLKKKSVCPCCGEMRPLTAGKQAKKSRLSGKDHGHSQRCLEVMALSLP